jgi:hypothetical protein
MRTNADIMLIFPAAGSFLLLVLSIFPGVLDDLFLIMLMTSCLWFPVVGIGGVVFLIRWAGRGEGKGTKRPVGDPSDEFAGVPVPNGSRRSLTVICLAVLLINLGLLVVGVPRRLSFAVSRPAFEPFLATAPTLSYPGVASHHRLGLYDVDQIVADPRGGVYFRTHSGPDGLGPDTVSYGFAYLPNPKGSPFGRAGYECSHLFGQWYSFNVSNDY